MRLLIILFLTPYLREFYGGNVYWVLGRVIFPCIVEDEPHISHESAGVMVFHRVQTFRHSPTIPKERAVRTQKILKTIIRKRALRTENPQNTEKLYRYHKNVLIPNVFYTMFYKFLKSMIRKSLDKSLTFRTTHRCKLNIVTNEAFLL